MGSENSANKDYIYYGTDEELWYWNPETERSVEVGSVALSSVDYLIRRLWYSQYTGNIFGIAYNYNFPIETGTSQGQEDNADAVFFKYDGSSITVINSSPIEIFTGEYTVRNGYTGGAGPHKIIEGENVPLIFDQLVHSTNASDADSESVLFGQSVASNTDVKQTHNLSPGYYSFDTPSGDTTNIDLFFSFGQTGFIIFQERSATDIKVYTFNESHENSTPNEIYKNDLLTGNQSVVVALKDSGSNNVKPLCGCADVSSSDIYVGGIYWNEASGNQDSVGVIYRVTASGTITRLYEAPSSGDEQYFTPLDLECNSSGLVASFFDRYRLFSSTPFSVGSLPRTGTSTSLTSFTRTQGIVKGFVRAQTGDDFYGYEAKTGKLIKYNNGTDTLTYLDDGFPAVENEYGLAVQKLAIDTDTRSTEIVYGISSPVSLPSDSYNIQPQGKYYLFKYDTFYSSRIPLFKTEGFSTLKCIEYLANIANYKAGFDESGDFYFAKRLSTVTTPDYIIDLDFSGEGNIKALRDISINSGEDDVYNFSRVQFNTVFLDPPDIEVRLVSRERIQNIQDDDSQTNEDVKPFDSDIEITQLDARKKILFVEVISGGLVSEGTVSVRYRSIDQVFESKLSVNLSSGGTTISLTTGVDSIKKGDTISLNTDDGIDEYEVGADPTVAQKVAGQVTIASALTEAYTIAGTFVTIRSNNDEWSDQRSNLLTNSFFTDFSGGDLIDWTENSADIDAEVETTAGFYRYGHQGARIELVTGTAGSIQQIIPASELEPNTAYTFAFDVLLFGGDGSDNSSTTSLIVLGLGAVVGGLLIATSSKKGWHRLESTFTTNSSPSGSVVFAIGITSEVATSKLWVDGAVVRKGRSGALDVIKLANESQIPIGNTNVELYITPSTTETQLVGGDRFVISCPGLDLKSDSVSVNRAIDITSRSIYGERHYPEINNPFVTRAIARDNSQRNISENGYPRYRISLPIPFNPNIKLINSSGYIATVGVRSQTLFPKSPGFEEICYIISKKHEPSRGKTMLELIGKNFI